MEQGKNNYEANCLLRMIKNLTSKRDKTRLSLCFETEQEQLLYFQICSTRCQNDWAKNMRRKPKMQNTNIIQKKMYGN